MKLIFPSNILLPEILEEREETLQKLNCFSIKTEEDWKKFKKMFDDVYKGFFNRLYIKFPELTVSEIRFLSLIKLKHTNNEIAYVLGISVVSVRKSCFKLREKLNIQSNMDLFDFIKHI